MQYRLILEYDGTDYHGWQVQPGVQTVQATLEEALERFLGHAIRVRAAGRTDTGVHAVGQVACFLCARALSPAVVLRALNALTPADVAVSAVDIAPDDFDPRRSARSRTYVYSIWQRRAPSPLRRRYTWHLRPRLDVGAMAAGAALLLGEHDFTSFRAAGCGAVHAVRQIFRSTVVGEGDIVRYEVEANGFLRRMVRNIVGLLVEVGQGRRAPEDVARILAARDRSYAGITAPARGLCLTRVRYE